MASPNPVSNNPRFYLWLAFAALLLLNYQAWMKDYAPPPQAAAPSASTGAPAAPAADFGNHIPSAPAAPTDKSAPGAPAPGAPAAAAPAAVPGAAAPAAAGAAAAEVAAPAPTVRVRTDVLDVTIGTRGGTLERVDLLAYPQVKGESIPVRLENEDGPLSLYLLQSGLTGVDGGNFPTHLALWQS